MAISKVDNRWLVDVRITEGSKRKRIRKKFPTKPEAIRFEAFIRNQSTQGQPWNPVSTDRRSLLDLIDRWYLAHGHTLTDGKNRKRKLVNLSRAMKDPLAIDVTSKLFVDTRSHRMSTGASANTVNHDLAYLKAVFNELDRLGEWSHGNPVGKVRKIQQQDLELTYLDTEQIKLLLQELKKLDNLDPYMVSRICFNTGARWGEAEKLKRNQVRDGMIWLQSKNGKPRSIPYVDQELDDYIEERHGALFQTCWHLFRTAIDRTGIELPAGQLTHVCRHTFASHFMQNGGDILRLQRILGHTTLTMTMRYAHLAPGHLADVPSRSPLANL